tara:strand:- start:854 stop:1486 length:633 start_codon:yes stop_codon:yes gene_type:complete
MKDLIRKLIKEEIGEKNHLNESSLNRIHSHILNHDCAIITAFRNSMVNCVGEEDGETVLHNRDNKERNKKLKSTLLSLRYGVTYVKGTYIENYMSDNSIEVKEDSYFVVNLNDDTKFIENIVRLGEVFCQDSVMVMEKGGENNYLYGTNYSDFPGYGQKHYIGVFKPGVESEFMTKIRNRPFTIETFDKLQISSKRLVKEYSKTIIDLLR